MSLAKKGDAGRKKKSSSWYKIMHSKKLSDKEYVKLVQTISIFVIIALVASIAIYIVIALIGGVSKVFDILASTNFYIFGVALIVVFVGHLIKFGEWNYFLNKLSIKVPLKKNLVTYLSLYSMDLTPGGYGRVVAAYTLNKITGKGFVSIIPVVVMQTFTDFLGLAIMAIASALYFHKYVFYVLIIDILLMLPFVFLLNKWFFNKFKKLIKKHKFLSRFTIYGEEYYASQTKLNRPDVYLVALAYTIPAALLTSLALYISILAVGAKAQLAGSIFVYSSAQIFGMITAIPGNIGVTDGALVALSSSVLHLSVSVSSAVTILTRIATLWFGVALGAVMLIYTLRYWKSAKSKK